METTNLRLLFGCKHGNKKREMHDQEDLDVTLNQLYESDHRFKLEIEDACR